MSDRYIDANPGYEYPDLQDNLHRPPGAPRAREIKSQKAQLNSTHRHGTQKDYKIGMELKTGVKERK